MESRWLARELGELKIEPLEMAPTNSSPLEFQNPSFPPCRRKPD